MTAKVILESESLKSQHPIVHKYAALDTKNTKQYHWHYVIAYNQKNKGRSSLRSIEETNLMLEVQYDL
jgi:hypothetical protein